MGKRLTLKLFSFAVAVAACLMLSTAVAKDEKEPKDLHELMEQVNDVNRSLLKHNRLNKIRFEGKAAVVEKDCEKLVKLAKLLAKYAPEADDGKKTIKLWNDSSAGVLKYSKEMVKAAQEKKQPDFRAAFRRTDMACTKCHEVYRDE